jgi:hypothetical protein
VTGVVTLTFADFSMRVKVLKLFNNNSTEFFKRAVIVTMICLSTDTCKTMSNINSDDPKLSVASPRSAEVEADLFSGRPNPKWELSGTLSARLVNDAAQLPVIEQQEMFDGLGYRGFLVNFDQEVDTETIVWRVKGEVLKISQAGTTVYKRDESRIIENSLLKSGTPYLDAAIFQRLEQEIKNKP